MKLNERDIILVEHMLECIERIEKELPILKESLKKMRTF